MKENKSLKAELRDTTKKLNDLPEKCDDLEQYSRRECVEIRGIPLPGHQQSENTDQIAIKVAGLMGLDVKDEDLSVSHRLKTSQTYYGPLKHRQLLSGSQEEPRENNSTELKKAEGSLDQGSWLHY